jgi:toxin ParE1/3/4
MKIIWSEFAEKQLDEIFDYYAKESSLSFATKLISKIIKSPDKLKRATFIGQVEEFLNDRPTKLISKIIKSPDKLKRATFIGQVEEFLNDRPIIYRYLVFKNYKIIYSVDEKNKLIKIADVFDTRQNPSKIKRSK